MLQHIHNFANEFGQFFNELIFSTSCRHKNDFDCTFTFQAEVLEFLKVANYNKFMHVWLPLSKVEWVSKYMYRQSKERFSVKKDKNMEESWIYYVNGWSK